MSKRRGRKNDTKKSPSNIDTILPSPNLSNPISHDIPNSIKFLRSFERIFEPTLYTKPRSVAYFCFSVTLLLSLSSTYFPSLRDYAIPKDNFLNVYFVKRGWGWTLLVSGSYLLYSCTIYTLLELKLITKHIGRLVVCTAMWYFCTNIFDMIQETNGTCTNETLKTPKNCTKQGFAWKGFDISGHCFLLTFCLLVMVEEFKTSKVVYWDSLATSFVNNNENKLSTLLYEHSQGVILIMKISALLLLFIWQWMLITSSLFYHSFSEAIIGTVSGIVSWWVTYVVCFHEQKYLTYPGDGILSGHFKEYSDLE